MRLTPLAIVLPLLVLFAPTVAAETCQNQGIPNGVVGIYTCDENGDGSVDRYEVRSGGTLLAVGQIVNPGAGNVVVYVHTYVPDTYTAVQSLCFGGWCYLAVSVASAQTVLIWHPENDLTPINYCLGGVVTRCGSIS